MSIRSPQQLSQLTAYIPGVRLTLFFLFFFPVFIVLGFWQLNRAEEKDQLLSVIKDQPQQTFTGQAVEHYSRLKVDGQWSASTVFYMDNRTYQGRAGYEIWVPFDTEFGTFLVAAGWKPVGDDRAFLPDFTLPSFPLDVSILIRPESINPLYSEATNEQNAKNSQRWLVQSLSSDWSQQVLQKPVLALAQLEQSLEWGVGPSVWQPTVMSPEKHRGYALQWFSMALALLCMFLYAAVIHKNNKEKRG